MPGIINRDNQSVDQLLRLFKKQMDNAGTLRDLKQRAHYEKPSVKRKRKQAAARKRKQKLSREKR